MKMEISFFILVASASEMRVSLNKFDASSIWFLSAVSSFVMKSLNSLVVKYFSLVIVEGSLYIFSNLIVSVSLCFMCLI